MAHLRDTFTSVNHCQYTWPYPMPILIKPSQPPLRTGIRSYQANIDPDDCKCDPRELFEDMRRYEELSDKECRLQHEIYQVNCEMSNLVTSMLDNSASESDTMRTVYQIDYGKRGIPIAKYRALMAATDSPVGSPIRPVTVDLRSGYRDPSRFRNSAIVRPTIQPASTVSFQRTPETCLTWQEPNTGQSEYVNGMSKLGLANMNSRQQYLEPQPSSRRRRGGA